jgi:hypothetical protein
MLGPPAILFSSEAAHFVSTRPQTAYNTEVNFRIDERWSDKSTEGWRESSADSSSKIKVNRHDPFREDLRAASQ